MNKEANAPVNQKMEPVPQKENKVLNTIINVVLILIIVFAIIVGYSAFVTKVGTGVPSVFGIRIFSIQSDSMVPTFAKGDLVVDTAVKDARTLKVGDVITFWTVIQGERVLNTHRIVEIAEYDTYISFTTKGDNNSIEDSLSVHQAEIVGKYKFHVPQMGKFLDFLQTSKGFFICIVIPVALFFLYYLVQFFRALFAYQSEKTRLKLEAMYKAQHPDERINLVEEQTDHDSTDSSTESTDKVKKKKIVKKVIVVEEEVDDEEESDESDAEIAEIDEVQDNH